jgi:hypothetical protein
MVGKLHDDIKTLERRLDELDNDPIMRMAASNYKAVIRKARAQTRARSIAAAKEKDPFWRPVKKPIVSNEDIR